MTQSAADRLIEQLNYIQRTHGELRGIIVNEPPESSWCEPPIPKAKPAFFSFDDAHSCHVWTESSQYTNAMHDFERLCPSLGELAIQSRDAVQTELSQWIHTGTNNPVLSWIWFVVGFAVMSTPGRIPRTVRNCWGRNGHYYDATKLESLRNGPLGRIAGDDMPPDASCWLVKVDNLIQVSVDAVGFMANATTNPPKDDSDQGTTVTDKKTLKQWTSAEETEARRLITTGAVTNAKALREMLSMRNAQSQALYRHIKAKQKQKRRTN